MRRALVLTAQAALALLALLLPSRSLPAAEPFLPGVQRILVLGDSITYGGHYVAYLETELLLNLPDRRLEIINGGLPSETVSGLSEEGHAGGQFPRPDLHERLDRVLAQTKPDLVLACYGMNDGIYLPLADDRFQRYQAGISRLREQVLAAGAQLILLTPPVFDPEPIRARVFPADQLAPGRMYAGYNEVLDRYAEWLLAQRDRDWRVIDLHGPMNQALADLRRQDARATFASDGVHPNAAGHRVLGQALVRGLELPPDPRAAAYGDPADPASPRALLLALVHRRMRVMSDAWLTATGHKRPMSPGLPLDQARAKAAELSGKIERLRKDPTALP